jgi:hypothetical protein
MAGFVKLALSFPRSVSAGGDDFIQWLVIACRFRKFDLEPFFGCSEHGGASRWRGIFSGSNSERGAFAFEGKCDAVDSFARRERDWALRAGVMCAKAMQSCVEACELARQSTPPKLTKSSEGIRGGRHPTDV